MKQIGRNTVAGKLHVAKDKARTKKKEIEKLCSLCRRFPFGITSVRIQWMAAIVAHALDNAQSLGAAFTEQHAITNAEELGTLQEAKRDQGPVSGSDVGSVNVDYGAGLADSSDVEHCLVFGADGCCVRQDEYYIRRSVSPVIRDRREPREYKRYLLPQIHGTPPVRCPSWPAQPFPFVPLSVELVSRRRMQTGRPSRRLQVFVFARWT